MSNNKCLGFIETFGLAACVAAADAAVKSANVKLLGYEYAKGGGMCTVKVEGNVGACRAAIAAGKKAAEAVNGSLSGTKSTLLKARPADRMRELLRQQRDCWRRNCSCRRLSSKRRYKETGTRKELETKN